MVNASDAKTAADQVLSLERAALDRWGDGDPSGFLDLYDSDVSYFDPLTAARIDGHDAMFEYYRPWTGKIYIARYEMLKPRVVVDGTMALLTYNLVNYVRDESAGESVGSCWNSTAIYQQRGDTWRSIHSHWSFTRHQAFQNLTAQATEGLR